MLSLRNIFEYGSPEAIAELHQAGRASLSETSRRNLAKTPVDYGRAVIKKPVRKISMVEDGFLWIDAEDFADYGEWKCDTQFIHLMGSAYLIAAGIGEPLADAWTTFDVPEAGRYRLWVRARNWLQPYAPGTFTVLINDKPIGRTFGAAEVQDWVWEPGGEFDLPAGKVRIALRDLTGYYGRCDALLLTTNLDYTPPNELDAVRQERARLTGLSLAPRHAGDFDVVVVGAGAAGSVAALASARSGARTALIQNRPVLGGNASMELGVPINGAASAHPNARETGIIEEVGRIKARYGFPKMSEPFRIAAQDERNLSVFLNQHVFEVEKDDQTRIRSVKAVDTLTGEISTYGGRVFIDCTGDGWVGYYAGADYRLGREARDKYNESHAPEKPDSLTMSGCLMGGNSLSYRAADMGHPVIYEPPKWAIEMPPPEEFGRRPRNVITGEWWLEHPNDIDDIWHAEYARDMLIRITYGYWDYIKNTWPERERAANLALIEVPIVEAKRESRRLLGDYVLTQNDLQTARLFEDRISYGGWPLDVHHPEGILSGKEGPFHSNDRLPIYSIPFRCLYSRNIDNLLFAGRDISVTHMALGSVRVQGTLAALGQAAGTAAAVCALNNLTPREMYREHMKAFQQRLLKDDQYIPGIKNEDPEDLARSAKVSVSSSRTFDEFSQAEVRPGDLHPLNMPRAVQFPVGARESLENIYVLLRSERAEPIDITLHLRGADTAQDFGSRENLATAKATAPPNAETWVAFSLDAEMHTPFAWIWLAPAEGVSWRLMSKAPLGTCRAYGGDARWTVLPGQHYAFYTDPPIAVPASYEPRNVVNGITRIIGNKRNMWASDPYEPFPQWIELDFGEPKRFNAVYLAFDTDLNEKFHTVSLVPQCVRDYALAVLDDGKWHTLTTVRGNFQRRRVHRFDTITAQRIRVTIHATNGDRSARVFEMRVYDE
ncbi:MAG: FAD-dependent oxidoreductase [Candidatus Hydrogenedentota bacterium]